MRACPPSSRELEVVRFLTTIRMRHDPRLRLYVVISNLSCHWTPKVREWAERSTVELVPTPTYASYLNRIECHVWAIQEFVIKNADYESWEELALAMGRHIGHRNGADRRPQTRRARATQAGGLSHEVSGGTFLGGPLASGDRGRRHHRRCVTGLAAPSRRERGRSRARSQAEGRLCLVPCDSAARLEPRRCFCPHSNHRSLDSVSKRG
jgi:hypothetical protein